MSMTSISPPVARHSVSGGAHDGNLRRIIAEDPEWSLALVPPLSQLCLQNIVKRVEGTAVSMCECIME